MDDRLTKKRKSSKSISHPSQEEKEAMTASLEKARLKEVRPVQPTPLEPPPSFDLPVVDLGTAASTSTAVSDEAATQGDFDYGDRYGGVQSTRYNSTAVDDQENDARNEFLYQQGHHARSASSSALGYVPGPFLRPLLSSRRIWPRPSCVYGEHERDSIASAGPYGEDFGGHRARLGHLYPRHPVVCWSG
jgi:hypothetical protein